MFECTWKTCFLITTVNQGSKVTSENFLCCFVQHEAFHLTAKYWMKIFRDKRVTLSWSSNSKTLRILLKNIKISDAHNFGNTGPILKIPTLLSSEASDLPLGKISWILVRVRWKIAILQDHLTWNDPLKFLLLPKCDYYKFFDYINIFRQCSALTFRDFVFRLVNYFRDFRKSLKMSSTYDVTHKKPKSPPLRTSLTKNQHPQAKKFFRVLTRGLASFETFTESVEHTRPEKFPCKATCV